MTTIAMMTIVPSKRDLMLAIPFNWTDLHALLTLFKQMYSEIYSPID